MLLRQLLSHLWPRTACSKTLVQLPQLGKRGQPTCMEAFAGWSWRLARDEVIADLVPVWHVGSVGTGLQANCFELIAMLTLVKGLTVEL